MMSYNAAFRDSHIGEVILIAVFTMYILKKNNKNQVTPTYIMVVYKIYCS